MSAVSAFAITHTALIAVLLPPVLVLGCLSLRNVKSEGDPLRGGFKWYHASVWFFFLFVSPYSSPPVPLLEA